MKVVKILPEKNQCVIQTDSTTELVEFLAKHATFVSKETVRKDRSTRTVKRKKVADVRGLILRVVKKNFPNYTAFTLPALHTLMRQQSYYSKKGLSSAVSRMVKEGLLVRESHGVLSLPFQASTKKEIPRRTGRETLSERILQIVAADLEGTFTVKDVARRMKGTVNMRSIQTTMSRMFIEGLLGRVKEGIYERGKGFDAALNAIA